MKRFRRSILFATGLFVLDAYFLNQGVIALFVMLLALFIFLPWSLWTLRRDKRLFVERMTRTGIYLLACMAVFVTNNLQNRMADRRAIALGNACLAYRAKYQHYPQRLQELVPEFLPSVPVAKYALSGFFFYSRPSSGGEPMLYYEELPPFGRRFYHMETGRWGYLD